MNKLCTDYEQVMHGEKPSYAPSGQKKGVKKTSSRARACAHDDSQTSQTLLLHNNSLSQTPRAGDAPTRARTRESARLSTRMSRCRVEMFPAEVIGVEG